MMRLLRLGVVVVVVGVFGGLVVVVYGVVTRGPRAVQPIAFNHALHLTDAGLECLDCHTDAKVRRYAGLPGKDMCYECHDPEDVAEQIEEDGGVHSELVKLISFADADGDLPWQRVAVTAPDVFFSHRRHVKAGGLDCLKCHPAQPKLRAPPRTTELVMSMDDCLACHERSTVTTDCLACHR